MAKKAFDDALRIVAAIFTILTGAKAFAEPVGPLAELTIGLRLAPTLILVAIQGVIL